MKRIVITGATGFVGRNCLPLFADDANYEVHALDLQPGDLGNVVWHKADLGDVEAARGLIRQIQPTHLLHLAWSVPPGEFWVSAENVAWIYRSFELLRSFAEAGGRRAVLIGSCAEYDWSGSGPCDEERTSRDPSTLYGIAKNALFQLAAKYSQSVGLNFAWARLFFMFGEGEPEEKFVSYLIRSLLENKTAVCRNPDQRRDYLYIKEVAAALKALLESNVEGAVNVASGNAARLGDLAKDVGEILHKGDLVEFQENSDSGQPQFLAANTKRLNDEVGWRSSRGLEDTLREYVEQLQRTREVSQMGRSL